MSLFEGLSISAYYGQLVVIGVGLWQMHRASTLRNKQLDEQHAETMAAHEESMTALKELIVRTAPQSALSPLCTG